MAALSSFIANVVKLIIQPLIVLLFALALFFFANGLFIFFLNANDPKERARGRQILIWGIVGFFVMVSAISIIAVVTKTFCGTAFCPTR
ncbi:hypothetical protein HY090_01365 [Candidatus Kaiserbacteria bacterium]|nr:hypothetical protein [Candidatus Kaiserbacteria bacterium]